MNPGARFDPHPGPGGGGQGLKAHLLLEGVELRTDILTAVADIRPIAVGFNGIERGFPLEQPGEKVAAEVKGFIGRAWIESLRLHHVDPGINRAAKDLVGPGFF